MRNVRDESNNKVSKIKKDGKQNIDIELNREDFENKDIDRKVTFEITEVNQILEQKEAELEAEINQENILEENENKRNKKVKKDKKIKNKRIENNEEEIHLDEYREKMSPSEKLCVMINIVTLLVLIIAIFAVTYQNYIK